MIFEPLEALNRNYSTATDEGKWLGDRLCATDGGEQYGDGEDDAHDGNRPAREADPSDTGTRNHGAADCGARADTEVKQARE